jgi:DNA-binding ferritin-like protein (Dps family)
MAHPSALNSLLRQQLLAAKQSDHQLTASNAAGTLVEVPGTGKALSSAYEQLRNAAENSEEHLLLERAIKRFYKRTLFMTRRQMTGLGNELIVELLQAGYLQGNKFNQVVADTVDQLIHNYMSTFDELRRHHIRQEVASDWILALLATETEHLLNPHRVQAGTAFFAYHHFLQVIDREQFKDLPDSQSYEFCLYMAIHQALLKSDRDAVRHELLDLYKQSLHDIDGFKHLNQEVDRLSNAPLTQQLKRTISRYGAPFRILKSMIDDRDDVIALLPHQDEFMEAYSRQISKEYRQLNKRLNKRLIKSIIFIFITKVLVGLAIEVPYDLLTSGAVDLLPLCVNLLFPPLYMASLKFSMRPPSRANSRNVRNYMEQVLYGQHVTLIQPRLQQKSSLGAKFVYTLLFAIPVALTVLILQRIGFNVVQMLIFFLFFSTASFLGFRLSSLVRDLELTTRQTGFLASLRDFFYLPFIVFGQWLSRKYSRINAVARFLDVAIELPLKAVLRLIRQWINFLNEKHEELY